MNSTISNRTGIVQIVPTLSKSKHEMESLNKLAPHTSLSNILTKKLNMLKKQRDEDVQFWLSCPQVPEFNINFNEGELKSVVYFDVLSGLHILTLSDIPFALLLRQQ